MKNILRISVAAAAIAFAQASFAADGDGPAFFVTGTVGVRADDNIYLSRVATDDVIFDVVPGIAVEFGRNANLHTTLTFAEAFARYSDNDHLNSNLFSGILSSNYDDEKLKFSFGTSFRQIEQNTVDIRDLTRRDVFNIRGNLEMLLTAKSSVAVGAMFDDTNYERSSYADTEIKTVPLNYYLKLTPKVDMSFGYRFRDTQVSLGQDSQDSFFNVGARGEFTPKLVGSFAVGYNRRSISGGNDRDQLGVNSSFSYSVTPKTLIQFGIDNDFGTSGSGSQQKNFTVSTGVNTRISEQWGYSLGLSRRQISYDTRRDTYWEGQVGVDYTIKAGISILASYTYRNNSSTLSYPPGPAYDPYDPNFRNNVFTIAANFRF